MWLRFSVQLLLSILMLVFIYQQINQSHLDFWFIIYYLFFMAVVLFWKPSENKKIDRAFMPRKFIEVEKNP
ncbi:hypothetical protein [Staphylococcus saprophyticus]|uniref:hypothetical protein n=1 Tax=Staphylococcus saprophyticus TaxID=29385 RepID=UPI000DFFE0E8|nr:hypothetical protein [Staphylococcus saprophyticus]SUN23110.1 Uncharacterised protein [Staphylococcus saprophyticus]